MCKCLWYTENSVFSNGKNCRDNGKTHSKTNNNRVTLIKTDADIASGNSGGPVLNEDYELIGIATEAISEELGNSQIGYIWPLWLVPDDWWQIAGVDRAVSP